MPGRTASALRDGEGPGAGGGAAAGGEKKIGGKKLKKYSTFGLDPMGRACGSKGWGWK